MGPGIKWWKWEWFLLLPVTFSGPLAKFSLPISTILGPAGLEVLFHKGGVFPLGNTSMVLLNWK